MTLLHLVVLEKVLAEDLQQNEEIFTTFEKLPSENLIKRTGIFDYYQVQINPSAINLNRNSKGAQVYQKYQSWLDLKKYKR